jgi:hypothetical protein
LAEPKSHAKAAGKESSKLFFFTRWKDLQTNEGYAKKQIPLIPQFKIPLYLQRQPFEIWFNASKGLT